MPRQFKDESRFATAAGLTPAAGGIPGPRPVPGRSAFESNAGDENVQNADGTDRLGKNEAFPSPRRAASSILLDDVRAAARRDVARSIMSPDRDWSPVTTDAMPPAPNGHSPPKP